MARSLHNIYKRIRYHNGEFHEVELEEDTKQIINSWFEANPGNEVHIFVLDRVMADNVRITYWTCKFSSSETTLRNNKLHFQKTVIYKSSESCDIDKAIFIAYMNALNNIQ